MKTMQKCDYEGKCSCLLSELFVLARRRSCASDRRIPSRLVLTDVTALACSLAVVAICVAFTTFLRTDLLFTLFLLLPLWHADKPVQRKGCNDIEYTISHQNSPVSPCV